MTSSQQKNDCVIVAISNATGFSYDEIAAKLPKPSTSRSNKGIQQKDWVPVIESFGYVKLNSIPRRGQDKITGIVRMISTKKATGHLVYIKNGILFDIWFPNGISIKEYQSRVTKCHIQMIWIKVDKTDTSRQESDTEVSLDFLRSLDE